MAKVQRDFSDLILNRTSYHSSLSVPHKLGFEVLMGDSKDKHTAFGKTL